MTGTRADHLPAGVRCVLACAALITAGCDSPARPADPPVDPPAPTLTITGRVNEPAANAPIAGARVCWRPPPANEARCADTVADGTYVLVMERPIFPGNPQGIRIAPFVSREGFEYRQSLIPYNLAPTLSWSPGMQRVLNLEAGATLTATVYPEEGYGGVEDGCDSCKVVRVSVPHAGDLTLSLKADDERLRLVLPNNHTPGEPFGVRGGDTVTVLVTQAMTPTEFHLTTTLSTPVSAR